jgi:hypothetical protein
MRPEWPRVADQRVRVAVRAIGGLAHELGSRCVIGEGARIICRDKVDASFAQLGVAYFLNHQIATTRASVSTKDLLAPCRSDTNLQKRLRGIPTQPAHALALRLFS